ncbi:MAG: glucuronate isomerase [Synergistaceae bacterium]|nr:glucuronate isomerase [Synergistaceae bacterium]
MDKDFLLSTQTAKTLFHDTVSSCPIIDYHCHLNPREIYENMHYDSITQVWLGGDHYKWRLMRCAGVPERFITGDASEHDKFIKWAEVVGRAIGNPLFHWSHLELRKYFGYQGVLNEKTAEEVWKLCNDTLHRPDFGARDLISMSNVETVCTTDDPADSLEWHEKIAADPSFKPRVLPAWRPDKAMYIEKPAWPEYLAKLSEAAGMKIDSFASLKAALSKRMDFFAAHGCKLSDHGMARITCNLASEQDIEEIFASRLSGNIPDSEARDKFTTAFMMFVAHEYHKRGWAMQIHYGVKRDNNIPMFGRLGADTGFDCVDNSAMSAETAEFLGELQRVNALPKTILYSLDGKDNSAIDTICGCFQDDTIEGVSKIQHGSAWWFEDHFEGMTAHMKSLASLGYLPGFIGMLTDSRSFLSYPRHEYFRRILCRLIGEWTEGGFFPADMDTLSSIVRNISYENAKRYFNF